MGEKKDKNGRSLRWGGMTREELKREEFYRRELRGRSRRPGGLNRIQWKEMEAKRRGNTRLGWGYWWPFLVLLGITVLLKLLGL